MQVIHEKQENNQIFRIENAVEELSKNVDYLFLRCLSTNCFDKKGATGGQAAFSFLK